MNKIKKITNFIKEYYEHILLVKVIIILLLFISGFVTLHYGTYIRDSHSDSLLNRVFTSYSAATLENINNIFTDWEDVTKIIAYDINNFYININLPHFQKKLSERIVGWKKKYPEISNIYLINKHKRLIGAAPPEKMKLHIISTKYFRDSVDKAGKKNGFLYFYLDDPVVMKMYPFYCPDNYGSLKLDGSDIYGKRKKENPMILREKPVLKLRSRGKKPVADFLYSYPVTDYNDRMLATVCIIVPQEVLQKRLFSKSTPSNYFLLNKAGYITFHPNTEMVGLNLYNIHLMERKDLNSFFKEISVNKSVKIFDLKNGQTAVISFNKTLPVIFISIFGVIEILLSILLLYYFIRSVYIYRSREEDVVGIFVKFNKEEFREEQKELTKYLIRKIGSLSILKNSINYDRLIFTIPINRKIDRKLNLVYKAIEDIQKRSYNRGFLAIAVSGKINIEYLNSSSAKLTGHNISLFNKVSTVEPLYDNVLMSEDVFKYIDSRYGIIKKYKLQIGKEAEKRQLVKLR